MEANSFFGRISVRVLSDVDKRVSIEHRHNNKDVGVDLKSFVERRFQLSISSTLVHVSHCNENNSGKKSDVLYLVVEDSMTDVERKKSYLKVTRPINTSFSCHVNQSYFM